MRSAVRPPRWLWPLHGECHPRRVPLHACRATSTTRIARPAVATATPPNWQDAMRRGASGSARLRPPSRGHACRRRTFLMLCRRVRTPVAYSLKIFSRSAYFGFWRDMAGSRLCRACDPRYVRARGDAMPGTRMRPRAADECGARARARGGRRGEARLCARCAFRVPHSRVRTGPGRLGARGRADGRGPLAAAACVATDASVCVCVCV